MSDAMLIALSNDRATSIGNDRVVDRHVVVSRRGSQQVTRWHVVWLVGPASDERHARESRSRCPAIDVLDLDETTLAGVPPR